MPLDPEIPDIQGAGELGHLAGLSSRFLRNRYRILFFTLLLTLMMSPILSALHFRTDLIHFFLLVNLVAAGFVEGKTRIRYSLILLVLVTLGLRYAGDGLNIRSATWGASILWICLSLFATIAALRFALRGRKVGSEQIGAALSAYLLAGQFFGLIYLQLAMDRPESFVIGGVVATAGKMDLNSSIYFSYVTLATLGYGDIVPLTPEARGIAVCEAIAGQLYLAVLVARLIGSSGFRKKSTYSGG